MSGKSKGNARQNHNEGTKENESENTKEDRVIKLVPDVTAYLLRLRSGQVEPFTYLPDQIFSGSNIRIQS